MFTFYWLALLLGLLFLALLLYWLLIATEGVFLGRRLVVWLYDITAGRYNAIKAFEAADEQFFVGRPIATALAGHPAPLLLDVATGSGRVPLALLAEPAFTGHIVGLDASGGMLREAAVHLKPFSGRVSLVQQTAGALPFAAHSFDAVTCLEAMEFLPSDEKALAEMARVLRPGGFLMASRRIGYQGKLFLHRYRPAAAFQTLLHRHGLVQIRRHLWQEAYELVTAVKNVT
jgi:ubiquinone/menaquinone biosynthesis C-methylase UbiE